MDAEEIEQLDVAMATQTGDPFTNKNPSYQIAFYLQHSGVAWGILTNGRLWRLFCETRPSASLGSRSARNPSSSSERSISTPQTAHGFQRKDRPARF